MVSDDGSRTLRDLRIDETYHGGCGAVSESIVVYLLNSGAFDRLENNQATRIFELGLGTATNFLLTAAIARRRNVKLYYHAVEPSLLPVSILSQLDLAASVASIAMQGNLEREYPNSSELFTDEYVQALVDLNHDFLTELSNHADSQETQLVLDLGCVTLTLYRERWTSTGAPAACENLSKDRIAGAADMPMHVVYFDAFSPANSPELWTPEVFETVYRCLVPGGVLVTYCVKGDVRRSLAKVGFEVRKTPGPPGGKREVLVATRPMAT